MCEQVGRELGVRYVLEGSVRKAATACGSLPAHRRRDRSHLWADRFDGTLEDVFELQDQVTASVVAAIEPNLLKAEIQRAHRKPTENSQAYDLLLRALPHFLPGAETLSQKRRTCCEGRSKSNLPTHRALPTCAVPVDNRVSGLDGSRQSGRCRDDRPGSGRLGFGPK